MNKRFDEFVSLLSEDEVRRELVLAYMQMERCQQVLRGEDVDPVEMKDNGDSSDLELFYQCKKCYDELSYLNGVVSGLNSVSDAEGE